MNEPATRRLPKWLKRPLPRSGGQKPLDDLLDDNHLVTVCEEANCPNKAQCFAHGTATFMILGDTCTRRCQFCSVNSGRPPAPPDPDEPRRLAETAKHMNLEHVVITSVDRDDLADGGSQHWANVVRSVRKALPVARIEVLTPDFRGIEEQIECVMNAGPDIYNHNIETVPSLYHTIQPGSDYRRSLGVLAHVKATSAAMIVKSGLMVGLGESRRELTEVFHDLHAVGVNMLTIGQYLKPSPELAEVKRYYTPEEFDEMRDEALAIGFDTVASGPFVRSSYNAKEQFLNL